MKKRYRWILLFLIIILAGGCVYVGKYIQDRKKNDRAFIEDSLASDGTLKKGINSKKLKEALQREIDKSKFTVGINGKIEFEDSNQAGAFCIENPSTNEYAMQVEIKRNDTKETIYMTAQIEPGYGVEKAKLLRQLKAGVYTCTATFTALKAQNKKGQVEVPVTIMVKK